MKKILILSLTLATSSFSQIYAEVYNKIELTQEDAAKKILAHGKLVISAKSQLLH